MIVYCFPVNTETAAQESKTKPTIDDNNNDKLGQNLQVEGEETSYTGEE